MYGNFYGGKFCANKFFEKMNYDRKFILGSAMLLLISTSIALNTCAAPFDIGSVKWSTLVQDPMDVVGAVH
jgi:hypothetical protein